ncbi:MAG: hypothetical protein PVH89_05825 [Gammaproteobacteria bacterium]|jgi:hypothetical protein
MSEKDPIRVFVCHGFADHPDYHRVFEYLESANNFFYVNCSNPDDMPTSGGTEAIRAKLHEQIHNAEVVLVVSTMFTENRELFSFQLQTAKTAGLPVIALEPFGGMGAVPAEVEGSAAAIVGWNDRSIVDAILLEARHEDTKRWEVIEFDMS